MVHKDLITGSINPVPLSTLIARWRIKRYSTGYDEQKIKEYLSTFGPIRTVKMISSTSARVVFEHLTDSCEAVKSKKIGMPTNPLSLHWERKEMINKQFYKRKGLKVKYDTLLDLAKKWSGGAWYRLTYHIMSKISHDFMFLFT